MCLQQMSRHRHGEMRRAPAPARRTAVLARIPGKAYEAVVLLARIDCDAGDHKAELEQARRLMALAPRRRVSLTVLWRAASCNGLASVERQPDLALQTLVDASPRVPSGETGLTATKQMLGTSGG